MWSYNRRSFILSVAALSGCGFTPAYGPSGQAGRLQNTVLVDEPKDRDAYNLVRQLEDRLGRPSAARYGLSAALSITEERMAVTANNITTRFNVVGKATYALRDLATSEVLTSGTVDSFTGYSATGTTVATLSASRDARERLMTILADQITTRLLAAAAGLPA
jgi:LPS-assembly lipoprotein